MPKVVRAIVLDGKTIAMQEMDLAATMYLPAGGKMYVFPTIEKANEGLARIGAIPYITRAQKLTAIYNALPDAAKVTYGVLFAPMKALIDQGNLAEAKICLQTLTVEDALKPTLTEMIKILTT